VNFSAIFHRWDAGSSSNGLIQEELGATVSPNATHINKRARNNGVPRNLKARIYDLERQLNEKEIIKLK
jgi:hypothetical protein